MSDKNKDKKPNIKKTFITEGAVKAGGKKGKPAKKKTKIQLIPQKKSKD